VIEFLRTFMIPKHAAAADGFPGTDEEWRLS
jgi:hypothetical protein